MKSQAFILSQTQLHILLALQALLTLTSLKMDEPRRITEPDLLGDITNRVSNLATSTYTQPPKIALVLLQPLGNPSKVAASLPPRSFSPHYHQYVNLQRLSRQWRQAVAEAPPISHLIFDLSLPRPDCEEDFEKVYWDTGVPEEGGIAVKTRDVMTLVITIATETRMRVEGKVKFEVKYEASEGVSGRAMKLLGKQLGELEKEYQKDTPL